MKHGQSSIGGKELHELKRHDDRDTGRIMMGVVIVFVILAFIGLLSL